MLYDDFSLASAALLAGLYRRKALRGKLFCTGAEPSPGREYRTD